MTNPISQAVEAGERFDRAHGLQDPEEFDAARKAFRAALAALKGMDVVEGWARPGDADCSCGKASAFEFNADCGHITTDQRAFLALPQEDA